VITESCGLATELGGLGAVLVTDGTAESLATAVEDILRDEALRQRLRRNGLSAVSAQFGLKGVVDELETIYRDAVQSRSGHNA
jgi:glycosyltransferase involved in cell wall biosynthesis